MIMFVWIMRYKIGNQWFYVTVRHQKDLGANIQAAQQENWQYEVFEIELPKEV